MTDRKQGLTLNDIKNAFASVRKVENAETLRDAFVWAGEGIWAAEELAQIEEWYAAALKRLNRIQSNPTVNRPNTRLLALRDINQGGLHVKAGEQFEVFVRWILGGLLTCITSEGTEVLLHNERLVDANVRIIADLEPENV